MLEMLDDRRLPWSLDDGDYIEPAGHIEAGVFVEPCFGGTYQMPLLRRCHCLFWPTKPRAASQFHFYEHDGPVRCLAYKIEFRSLVPVLTCADAVPLLHEPIGGKAFAGIAYGFGGHDAVVSSRSDLPHGTFSTCCGWSGR